MENEKPPRILLVEDQALLAKVVQALLTQVGMTVDIAENGSVATKMLLETPYVLVITDLMMPIMDGLQLVEWIRCKAGLAVPVVVLSAKVDAQHSDQLAKLGVRAIFMKPLDMERFAQEVKVILDAHA
ncbi:MAG: response regulator [Brachymonas sp.]|nr:response regulator [Brachymonas sp.]